MDSTKTFFKETQVLFTKEELRSLNGYRGGRLVGNGCGMLLFGFLCIVSTSITTGYVSTFLWILLLLISVGLGLDYIRIWMKGTKDFEAGYSVHVTGEITGIQTRRRGGTILMIGSRTFDFGRASFGFAQHWKLGDIIDVSFGVASQKMLAWKKIEKDGSVSISSEKMAEEMNKTALIKSKTIRTFFDKLGPSV